ncbi:hypothetical protein IPF86_00320 [Candidatus Nomurabacteria bacterium]|jgi:hypothetical protein|nr:MAG: hypothetical protein IPF86_00320 [Candidatus Nomurabacteria bacterium]
MCTTKTALPELFIFYFTRMCQCVTLGKITYMEQATTKNTSQKKFTFFESLLLPFWKRDAYKKAKELITTPNTKQIDIIRAIRKLSDYHIYDKKGNVVGNPYYIEKVMDVVEEHRYDVLDRIARNNLAEFETDFA